MKQENKAKNMQVIADIPEIWLWTSRYTDTPKKKYITYKHDIGLLALKS